MPRSTVTLTGPGIPPGTTDTTDASGFYGFPGLAPGSYSVQVDTASLPVGAVSTTGGFTAAGVVITSGADDLSVDFGVALPADVGDLVFSDNNGNGVFDAGDAPASNVQLTITGPGLPPAGVTDLTDASGLYGFSGLLPGTFTVVGQRAAPGRRVLDDGRERADGDAELG